MGYPPWPASAGLQTQFLGLPNGRLTAVLPPNTFRDEMHNDTHKRILMTAVQGLEACQTRG